MATKKKPSLKFEFSAGNVAPDDMGKVQCYICFDRFPEPEVEVMLRGWTVCPECILSGPSAVAAAALRAAESKDRFAQPETVPGDNSDIVSEYRLIAKHLRRVKFFEDIPGGRLAVAIARVTAKGRPRRKAA